MGWCYRVRGKPRLRLGEEPTPYGKYETEQASRDKWRELLLLLARPIGESHVAVEAARSERSACFNRDRTNTPTCARVQCAGCR